MTRTSGPTQQPSGRPPRRGELPALSVVIASTGAPSRLNSALAALLPQCERFAAQVVVVRASDAPPLLTVGAAVRRDVQFVSARAGANMRELRNAGMAASSGDIVAITDDGHVESSDWLGTMLRRSGAKHGPIATA